MKRHRVLADDIFDLLVRKRPLYLKGDPDQIAECFDALTTALGIFMASAKKAYEPEDYAVFRARIIGLMDERCVEMIEFEKLRLS